LSPPRGGQPAQSSAGGYPQSVADAAILVVDDDALIRRMLERTLRAEGYDVRSAADGGAALAAIERSVPDAMLLDVAMAGMDGLAVCRSCCSLRATLSRIACTDSMPARTTTS
jgi:CheY-like chemotaxis protein